MQEASNRQQPQVKIDHLTRGGVIKEVLHGMGVTFGLALLWMLEMVRNGYFRMLDRLGVKPRRPRRVSAFPPGQPRKRVAAQARR
jgi:hypothetical protein